MNGYPGRSGGAAGARRALRRVISRAVWSGAGDVRRIDEPWARRTGGVERKRVQAELEEQAVEVRIADPEARRARRPLHRDPARHDMLVERGAHGDRRIAEREQRANRGAA